MSESRNEIWNKLSRLGVAAQSAVLALVVALAAVPVSAIAYAFSSTPGVLAALAAGFVCLLGGEIALAVGTFAARHLDVVRGVLIGMMARMAVPLLLGVGVHLAAPSLTAAGMFFYFLAFYAVVLAVETMFSVAHVSHASTSPKAT